MIKLSVPDMSCGHCAGVITTALKALDSQAVIAFDMPARAIDVDTGAAPSAVLDALSAAGYPAVVKAATPA